MSFPVVESLTPTTFGVADTAHLVAMPAVVDEGNALLMLFSNDSTPTILTPSGWTLAFSSSVASKDRYSALIKKADGTEGGTTVDVVTSASEQAVAQVYRISNWGGSIDDHIKWGVVALASSTTPNPPSLTPPFGQADTLWIATSNFIDGAVSLVSGPTDYTDETLTNINDIDGSALMSARRLLNAATEDPGVFTVDLADDWIAQTFAIRGPLPADKQIPASFGPQVIRLPGRSIAG